MESWQREFIEFVVRSGVLAFGEFVTKSGRATPYFFNLGRIASGAAIERLGEFYAHAIEARFADRFDCLFGPAYKGIPLAVAAAAALARHGRDVPFAYNRKEIKDHGEKGALVGHPMRPGERVLIVEDVATAGTSVRESVRLLEAAAGAQVVGLIVAIDRQERGEGPQSALAELSCTLGIETAAIVTLDDVIEHLAGHDVDGRRVLDDAVLARIAEYRARYGAR